MYGVGKSQLFYVLTNIFWMQAMTIEKLCQGFSKLLHLMSHPDHSSTNDNTRLTAARHWLKDFDSGRWLIYNITHETVEHLPWKNGCSNPLFTCLTEDIAKALTTSQANDTVLLSCASLMLRMSPSYFCSISNRMRARSKRLWKQSAACLLLLHRSIIHDRNEKLAW